MRRVMCHGLSTWFRSMICIAFLVLEHPHCLMFHFAAESDVLIPVPPRILNVVVVSFVVVA